jgi:myo-inositol 2-dehydrogenase / D-chiro-inositol 1-dehydrogenase
MVHVRVSEIGLAVVGCGTIGRIRAELAREHAGVGWLGLCDIDRDLAGTLATETGADFVTQDFKDIFVE